MTEAYDPIMQLNPIDTVAVARKTLHPGDIIRGVRVQDVIPAGHKVALASIAQGQAVVKYGHPIGVATRPIQPGQWVHGHNVATRLTGKETYEYEPALKESVWPSRAGNGRTFSGYVREDGTVGIRNEIWIIPTVGCVNKTAERLASMAQGAFQGRGIDGVYSFPHPYGCSQLGEDLAYTQKLLAGLTRHPNAAAVLVLGLGCETNRISEFVHVLGPLADHRVQFLTVQEVEDEWETGLRILGELVAYAERFHRTPVPLSRLTIGLKCGGSDGFSGITANPLVGVVSDRLVDAGATTLLTEVPEMFGAETLLMARARDRTTFENVVRLINDFKDYYLRHGQVIYENPSPGNKDGGITTLEEKSLGCIQKGGQSIVADVVPYGEQAKTRGLNLVAAPGNDMVSVTALAAAGAQMVLFTTGRGTPLGGPVPTVKISTNSTLATRKPGWIDFDAGRLLQGASMSELADELLALVVDIASGRPVANERQGFREIAIFKIGVTL